MQIMKTAIIQIYHINNLNHKHTRLQFITRSVPTYTVIRNNFENPLLEIKPSADTSSV